MVVLGLDIGEKRVGIAVSDAQATLAMPVKVLPTPEVVQVASSFKRILQDYEPELIVAGRPLTMAGERGPQADRIEQMACQIAERIHLPLEFEDERLSSAEAKRIMHEQGLSERQMRGKLDAVAASIFLQTWLDNN